MNKLPTELRIKIVDLLGPYDIKSLYSTSRLWKSLSETRYTKYFYETILVPVDLPALERLDAISRDTTCRRRVKRVALTSWLKVSEAEQNHYPEEGHPEQAWLLKSHLVASMVTGALARLDSCSGLHLKHDFAGTWVNESMDRCPHEVYRDFHSPVKRHFRESHNACPVLLHEILQTAFAILAACNQIREFDIDGTHNALAYHFGPAKLPNPRSYVKLEHVQVLAISLDSDLWKGHESAEALSSFLEMLPNLKSLSFNFAPDHNDSDVNPILAIAASVSKLEDLYLLNHRCHPGDLALLVKSKSFEALRRLTLDTFDLEGGVEVWIEILELTCDYLKLDVLCIINIFECHKDVGGFHLYALDKFAYYGINETKKADLVYNFKKWVAKSSSLAYHRRKWWIDCETEHITKVLEDWVLDTK